MAGYYLNMDFHVAHVIAESLEEMQQGTDAQSPCLLSSTQGASRSIQRGRGAELEGLVSY